MRYLLFTYLLMTLVSCSTAMYHSRTKFDLKEIDGIIISNTVTNPYKVLGAKGVVKFEYSLIIKNTNEEVISIDLRESQIHINEERKSLNCSDIDGKKEFDLASGSYARINCLQVIKVNNENMLNRKDTLAKLLIVLNPTIISEHTFKLKREDFR